MSNHNRPHCQSLVDRSDNVGVAGEDVNVINTQPNRQVKILGIDNNEINSVSIDTIGYLDH